MGALDMEDQTTERCLLYTSESVESYLQAKRSKGVAASAVVKYKNALNNLNGWLGGDKQLTGVRLQAWRQHLEDAGYSKHTIQRYVTRVNSYLQYFERDDLHIAKPIRYDLAGRRFGYLTALESTGKRRHKYIIWRCVCKCGKEVEVPSGTLLSGHTTSCGCLNAEILQHRNRYEEGTELRQAMEEKVFNPNSVSGYVGVQPKRDKWTAYINYKGIHYHLGTYNKLEDAVKARARAKEAVMEDAARIYEETRHLYGDAPSRPVPPEKLPIVHSEPAVFPMRRSDNTSGHPGVTQNRGRWVASISVKKCRYRLGTYDRLEDAVAARTQAEELVKAGDIDSLKAISVNGHT